MTVHDWLKDVYYDENGEFLWSKQDENGGSQIVAMVRGWGAIQQMFGNLEQAAAFQDEVGRFIADAINEKLQREKEKAICPVCSSEQANYVTAVYCRRCSITTEI